MSISNQTEIFAASFYSWLDTLGRLCEPITQWTSERRIITRENNFQLHHSESDHETSHESLIQWRLQQLYRNTVVEILANCLLLYFKINYHISDEVHIQSIFWYHNHRYKNLFHYDLQ